MKTYVLTVSRTFPVKHRRKGEPTYFVEKIYQGIYNEIIPCKICERNASCNRTHCIVDSMSFTDKLHTIRSNYPLWKKRFDEIEADEACLSVRYWSGKPYRSKQVEIVRLTKEDGIGLQRLKFPENGLTPFDFNICLPYIRINRGDDSVMKLLNYKMLSKNDGLSFEDFKEWFKGYDLSEPMALIQFTGFRY